VAVIPEPEQARVAAVLDEGAPAFTHHGNDAAATSLNAAPGDVIFGTSNTISIALDSIVGSPPSDGSARILSTSKNVACTTFLMDATSAPPESAVSLTMIRKTTRKATN
jgi:hypothetical protein